MTKQWYAVCDKETGELKSTGTVLPETLDGAYEVIGLDEPWDAAIHDWDAANKRKTAKVRAPKPFTIHRVLDRLTAEDAAEILKRLGLSPARAEQLTAGQ
jgi:hypothetical protein